jgi:hypothetical protein
MQNIANVKNPRQWELPFKINLRTNYLPHIVVSSVLLVCPRTVKYYNRYVLCPVKCAEISVEFNYHSFVERGEVDASDDNDAGQQRESRVYTAFTTGAR